MLKLTETLLWKRRVDNFSKLRLKDLKFLSYRHRHNTVKEEIVTSDNLLNKKTSLRNLFQGLHLQRFTERTRVLFIEGELLGVINCGGRWVRVFYEGVTETWIDVLNEIGCPVIVCVVYVFELWTFTHLWCRTCDPTVKRTMTLVQMEVHFFGLIEGPFSGIHRFGREGLRV